MLRRLARTLAVTLSFCVLLTACQSHPWGLTTKQVNALKQEGFTLSDEGWVFNLSGKVLFSTDSEAISPQSAQVIKRITTTLVDVAIHNVILEGHTDTQGNASYNQKLSERRANSVRDEMISFGMPARDIKAIGYGQARPVADNNTSEGRSQNRRVAILIGAQ